MTRLVQTLAQMLALVLLLSAPSALAQAQDNHPSPAAPTAQDKVRARELYAKGQQLFRQGDFATAQRSFEDAYRAVPNPIVLLSIAECQVRTEQYTEAVVSLTRYLEERPSAPDKAQVEAQIQKLREKPGIVTVQSTPPGAAVWVDGKEVGLVTPVDVELLAGDHLIEVEARGYLRGQQSVSVLIGARADVNLTLLPAPAPEPEQPAETAATSELQADTGSRSKLPIWIATGIAGAGAVTGAVLGGLALKEKNDFDKNPTTQTADKGERFALFADVGFGIAAAAGVTALVLYFTQKDDSAQEQQAFSVQPAFGKNRAGLVGNLRF